MIIPTQRLDIQACTPDHLRSILNSSQNFEAQFQLRLIPGYIEFPGTIEYSLQVLESGAIPMQWSSHFFVHREARAVIGFGGYKSAPHEGIVEIGYGIAPEYRNQGFATEATAALIKNAFASKEVSRVWAHTLAEFNASTTILTKCRLTKIAEIEDPDDGKIWRWEKIKIQQ